MYYIGFDIGGTKCAVSLARCINHNIEILDRYEIPTDNCPYETIGRLSYSVINWKDKYNVAKAGISCGGPLDSKNGVIISTPNLSNKWHGFKIVSYINKTFGLEAKLENDANASAIAEWKFGAGNNAKNMIFLTFGTGLGAGLILDGKLYSGTNGNAGEVGHIRLENFGPIGYNKEGSAEGFCSGGGIYHLAQLRAKEQKIDLPIDITTKQIFNMAKQGDEFCFSIVKESAEKFGRVLSVLIDLFNPEVIVAGGVFMRNYDMFMSIISPIIEKESLNDSYKVCKILPAKIGENFGDYASVAIACLEE